MDFLSKISRGDRLKTQKLVLKMEDSTQYMIENENKVDLKNDFSNDLDAKAENDGWSKSVFGRSEGGIYLYMIAM